MRINTNVSALNAQRNLGNTQAAINTSMQRLSSGFRINRAADDAAGLGIANQLRANTRSLVQASRNAEQANTLAQIAEGSVGTVQTMLERMKELATQANSDTVDVAGRQRLNQEFDQLRGEIQRTAETTKFGGTQLINGGFGTTVDAGSSAAGVDGVFAIRSTGAALGEYTLTHNDTDNTITMTSASGLSQEIAITDGKQTLNFSQFGIAIETAAGFEAADLDATSVEIAGGGGSFMVSSSGSYDGSDLLSFSAIDMRSESLGIDGLALLDAEGAQGALTAIDSAISTVNEALGSIGAFQNRVEYALDNARTAIQNLSAAESVIRDVDMAEEMSQFSKNQILSQAGTAMLAQANQSAQGVLQLLRG